MTDLSQTDNIYTLQLLMEITQSEACPLKGSLPSRLKCLCCFTSPSLSGEGIVTVRYIISTPIFCLSKRDTKIHVIQVLSRENTPEQT